MKTIAPLPLKIKFAKEIGTRIYLRIYWGDNCSARGCHNAMFTLRDELHPLILGTKTHMGGAPENYPEEMWPKVCEDCGMPVPKENINKQVFNQRIYNTPSGLLEPGCIWYAHWLPLNIYFDNQQGFILMAKCPDGSDWCIDSRASNCTMPNDRNHHCWTRSGDPESGNIDVGNQYGPTCQAGAGSIMTNAGWHGFLHQGFFVG